MCHGRALCDVVGVNIVQAVQAKYRFRESVADSDGRAWLKSVADSDGRAWLTRMED